MVGSNQCDVSSQSSHCFNSLIALFFCVFTDVIFVRYLYCFYLMPVTENKKLRLLSLGEESRSFYMFCVVSEWRL